MYICQQLTNLYHISTILILGKLLCQIAVYGNLVKLDLVIIRFLLSQRWEKCFYPNETLLIPTKSYLLILKHFKSCKNICIPPTQCSQYLLFKLLSLCPHLFPQGFSSWPGKLVLEYYFTGSQFFQVLFPIRKQDTTECLSESCSCKYLRPFS